MALTGWVRIERSLAMLFVAIILAASVIGAPTARFKLEVQYPNGGSEMHLLSIGRPDTSGHSEVRAGAGPQGAWSEVHLVVTEFEVLSIGQRSVSLRFRSKRFDRQLNAEQALRILEADKVPWHMIRYIPGTKVSVPVENGQPLLLSGSVAY